jgi:hypothetical protein
MKEPCARPSRQRQIRKEVRPVRKNWKSVMIAHAPICSAVREARVSASVCRWAAQTLTDEAVRADGLRKELAGQLRALKAETMSSDTAGDSL